MFYLEKFKQPLVEADISNLGRPLYFDTDHYLDSVEQMISADEILFAKQMIENMPGWYRDNPPKRALEIKAKLAKQLWTITDYINDSSEINLDKEKLENSLFTLFCTPRAPITARVIQSLNEQGIKPILVELGPADYWLPVGLKVSCHLDFDYFPVTLNKDALNKVQNEYYQIDWISHAELISDEVKKSGRPVIYVCFEVIEHMEHPEEIAIPVLKYDLDPQIVILSTPLYVLGGGLPDWDTRELGHIRTWTPKEFKTFAENNFKGYVWDYTRDFSQVLLGIKANNP